MNNKIAIEIVAGQIVLDLDVAIGTTILDAIKISKMPNIDFDKNNVGIYGKIVALTTKVQAGDRIEIYRPLLIDPKQARLNRANA